MKYIICGKNRVAKDFMYMFENLDILGIVDDVDLAIEDNAHDQIILCDFDKTEKEKRLQQRGMAYGKDYVYEEDFLGFLDPVMLPKDRKLAVWGTGNMCQFLLKHKLPKNRRHLLIPLSVRKVTPEFRSFILMKYRTGANILLLLPSRKMKKSVKSYCY